MLQTVGVRRSEDFHSFQLRMILHLFQQNSFICLLFVSISTSSFSVDLLMQSEETSSESYEYDWTYTYNDSDEMDENTFSDR